MRNRLFIFLSVFSGIAAVETGATDPKSESPLSIEIVTISRQYLNRKNQNSAQITLKTDAAALYEVRSGFNCRTSQPLSESKYHGVAKAGENSIVTIDSADLKDGHNNLVICFNREVLLNSSSRDLNYQTKVYEKNIFLIIDSNLPEIAGFITTESESKKTIHLHCSDSFGCEKIFYTFDKENPRDGLIIEGQSVALPLNDGDTAKAIFFTAQDKAGNFSETKTIALNNEKESPYGRGRFTVLPAYFFRLDSGKDKTPGGAAIFLAADFGLHHFLKKEHRVWLPGLRLEAALATYRGGDNTADQTGLYLGPVWLIPLMGSQKLALVGGTTWGVGKMFTIYADNTTISATALSGNLFAGVEYTFRGLVFSLQGRTTYIASAFDMLLAVGGGVGVGVRF